MYRCDNCGTILEDFEASTDRYDCFRCNSEQSLTRIEEVPFENLVEAWKEFAMAMVAKEKSMAHTPEWQQAIKRIKNAKDKLKSFGAEVEE